jgi:hypothetical protein
MGAFLGFGATMQSLYAVPWRNPARRALVSLLVAAILVFSIFALLKTNSGDKRAPAPKELLASNSIERPPAVRSSASNDQIAAFLAPAPTQPVRQPVQRVRWIEGQFHYRVPDRNGCESPFNPCE